MSSIIGVWKLQSFEVTADGNVERPFGKEPVGLLVFSNPQGGAPYMCAQLTSNAGAPTFSFSAYFEVISDHRYRFTPVATNNPAKFPIGVTTAPKEYQIQGQIFKESWVDEGKSFVATWRRLHDSGECFD